MNRYPQSEAEWNNPALTLFRNFKFQRALEIEILICLVKQHVPPDSRGLLRARLLGTLYSMQSRTDARTFIKNKYPRTWRLQLLIKEIIQWTHRTLNTPYFKDYVLACQILEHTLNERN